MASGQDTQAKIRIYRVTPNKDKRLLFQGVNARTGPGGAPDGAQATVKDNELPSMGVASSFPLRGGDKLQMTVELSTADGIDASDCVFNVPIVRNGQVEELSIADFGFTVDYPASTPASVELPLGAGYTVPENDTIFLGGGKFFISVENDTA